MRRTIPPRLRTLRTVAAAVPTTVATTTTTTTTALHLVPRYPSVFTRSLATERRPFWERVRRKLWGTDSPPGPEDPYRRLPEQPVIEDDDIDRSKYVQAIDGRSLPIVGLDQPLAGWEVPRYCTHSIVSCPPPPGC